MIFHSWITYFIRLNFVCLLVCFLPSFKFYLLRLKLKNDIPITLTVYLSIMLLGKLTKPFLLS